ncbi:MAG: hypothetical protein HYV27_25515 [Candidatus Hydrogenedentes bacterium]|nr:hypothetical protein [Candidatus Hydrogenedentota bacterium]
MAVVLIPIIGIVLTIILNPAFTKSPSSIEQKNPVESAMESAGPRVRAENSDSPPIVDLPAALTNEMEHEATGAFRVRERQVTERDAIKKVALQPLGTVLKSLHDFTWTPMDLPDIRPFYYAQELRQRPEVRRLLQIAAEGSTEEKEIVSRHIHEFMNRFLTDYPLIKASSSGDLGDSALSPYGDEALFLLLPEFDYSQSSYIQLQQALSRHTLAIKTYWGEQGKNLPSDEVHHSGITYLLGDSARRLLERALADETSWIYQQGMAERFRKALNEPSPGKLSGYLSAIKVEVN